MARFLAGPVFALLMLFGLPARAELDIELVSPTAFRVCADPANLPFSNDKGEGFENKIAEIFAQDLHRPLKYTWFPQTVGFVRNTLLALKCDVIIGVPSGAEMMISTTPYYRTGYMSVTRSADHIAAVNLGDPILRGKRIGVIARSPPSDLLIRHGWMREAVPYELNVDTRLEDPAHQMLLDLVAGKIDVALVWGPIAGYYIQHDHLPLTATFLQQEPNGTPLAFNIAMGVRASDITWRRTLNRLIARHQQEITKLLLAYGVPLLDADNKPITHAGATAKP